MTVHAQTVVIFVVVMTAMLFSQQVRSELCNGSTSGNVGFCVVISDSNTIDLCTINDYVLEDSVNDVCGDSVRPNFPK